MKAAPPTPVTLATTGTVCESDAKSCASGRRVSANAEMVNKRVMINVILFMVVSLRIGDRQLGRHVGAAVTLQQPLMRERQEGEAVEEVLVVDFHAPRQSGAGIAGCDEAEQDGIDVDLMLVRRGAAAEAASVREARVD